MATAQTVESYITRRQHHVLLLIAVQACKARFPRCGGILVWTGHDSFPGTTNTSIIDFWARPKPAALALHAVFTSAAGWASDA